LVKNLPLEDLDKEVYSGVIPISDEQERLKGVLESSDF